MLVRILVPTYPYSKADAIKTNLVNLGLAQNVSLEPHGIIGDFNAWSDYDTLMTRLVRLKQAFDCCVLIELG